MGKTLATTMLVLLSVTAVGASKELLLEVDPNKAERIAEYNSVFLQDLLYFSSRSRIVTVDRELLLSGEDFTLTPFDDIEPLEITRRSINHKRDFFIWIGEAVRDQALVPSLLSDARSAGIQASDQRILDSAYPPINISMFAWDVDPEGNASVSSLSPFRHSEIWEIDASGTPFLPPPPQGESVIAGPPPRTPEDIEYHRKLKTLNRRSFYSVVGDFRTVDLGSGGYTRRYVLTALKYSPKYTVIWERDPEKSYRVQIDYIPGGVDNRDESDKVKYRTYDAFKKSLPIEEGKAVKGEIE